MNLTTSPASDSCSSVKHHLHKADHSCVLDLYARESAGCDLDRQSDALQQREIDVDVQPLGLIGGEAVGDGGESPADSGEVVQAFFEPEVGKLV